MSEQPDALERRCRALVEALGLGRAEDVGAVRALGGGVASDIVVVDLPGGQVCLKFALPRLKVAEEWLAPVHRNAAEYAWLKAAGEIVPGSVPPLHGHCTALQGFAMAYLGKPDWRLWKSDLLAGRVDIDAAAAVGHAVGRVHAASTRAGFDTAPFRNRDDFRALRLEPYLLFCAAVHPALSSRLHALVDGLYAADTVLVHGDVSPKNILLHGPVPVVLDAECATLGDPSFDVAFCLNHLVLKSLHRPGARGPLLQSVRALWHAYRSCITWEPVAALEARVCALLPALMLARIDGKSPVEYLDERARDRARRLSMPMILEPLARLEPLLHRLSDPPPTGDCP